MGRKVSDAELEIRDMMLAKGIDGPTARIITRGDGNPFARDDEPDDDPDWDWEYERDKAAEDRRDEDALVAAGDYVTRMLR